MTITTTNTITTTLLKTDFDDKWPIIAARTSTKGAHADTNAGKGLINALIRDRHGVPFEHCTATVRITVPIFVMRQLVKHRAGLSLSEESGRYKELEPVFYVPGDRPLCQVGKPMDYNLVHGDVDADEIRSTILDAATLAYSAYRCMIRDGVAREVARMVLPLNLMTTGVITFNARSLMHFLSLRTDKPGSQRVSHPQYEIEMLADQLEVMFKRYMPITWAAFNEHGRLAP